ncbi:MAG: helix-turn-helix transcriptional regulator [Chloroflexi bacterium]|nr:helix-turn-helix transcriptional regulator [Chloroflexota bacterium]
MADFEDEGTVSVGGWVTDLAEIEGPVDACRTRSAFSKLIRLAQRERNLTQADFAREADVSLTELVRIESRPDDKPSPEMVSQVARFLGCPERELNVLAGLLIPPGRDRGQKPTNSAARSTQESPRIEHDEDSVPELLRRLTQSKERS